MKKLLLPLAIASALSLHAEEKPNFQSLQSGAAVQTKDQASYDHQEIAELMRKYDSLLKDIQAYGERSKELKDEAQKMVNDAKRRSANARAVTGTLVLLTTVAGAATAEGMGDSHLADDILVDGLLTTAVIDGSLERTGDRNIDRAVDNARPKIREAANIDAELMRWQRELNELESQLDNKKRRVMKKINSVLEGVGGFDAEFGKVLDVAFDEEGDIQVLTVAVQGKGVDVTLGQLESFIKDNFQSLINARTKDYEKAVEIAKKAETDKLEAQNEIDNWKSEVNWWLRLNARVPWSKRNDRYKKVSKFSMDSTKLEDTSLQAAKKVAQTKALLDRANYAQQKMGRIEKKELASALKTIKQM